MSNPDNLSEIVSSTLTDSLRDLEAAVALRRQAEQAYLEQFGSEADPQQEALARELATVVDEHALQEAALTEQFDQQRQDVERSHQTERETVKGEHDAAVSRIRREAQQENDRVNRQHEDSSWVATSVLDETSEESPQRQYERNLASLDKTSVQHQTQLASLQEEVRRIREARGWTGDPPPPPETAARDLESFAAEFTDAIETAHRWLSGYKQLRLPKLFVGMRPAWLFALFVAAIGGPVYLFAPLSFIGESASRTDILWIAMTAGTAMIIGTLLLTVLYTISTMQVSDAISNLEEQTSAAEFFHERWAQLAGREEQRRQRDYEELREQREQQLQSQLARYDEAHQQTLADVEHRRQTETDALLSEYTVRTKALDAERDARLKAIENERQRLIAELTQSFEKERDRRQQELDLYAGNRQQQQQQVWEQLHAAWFTAVQAFDDWTASARQESTRRNLDWPELAQATWEPPRNIPEEIRIGEQVINLTQMEDGISPLKELTPPTTTFRLPASLPFPASPSLLLEVKGQDGRRDALQAMQVALLRFLTRIPPGKLRLTVIDPVGLGESFSGLMHLADYDELLITSRIWTELGHIEARLAELTEHMENVLQKYLRNEFATIEEYNRFAGEVAEPYHVLVVADFPHKFSEQAAKRLVSIATSGPRCGVYLLMSTDITAQMPHAFDLESVEATTNTFEWRNTPRSQAPAWERPPGSSASSPGESESIPTSGNRVSQDVRSQTEFGNEVFAPSDDLNPGEFGGQSQVTARPAFYLASDDLSIARWPLVIDTPPSPEVFTRIVKNVGEASKDIRRVEVSFSRIAPKPGEVWSKDSRGGIDIPLGRAGATKLQHLRLGKGTSQHMLVAGKTGSGKSTFFHTLITNVALYYSPEEVELYLVDFKKGVEFKAYAPQGERRVESGEQRAGSRGSRVQSPVALGTANSQLSTLDSGLWTLNTGLPHARVIAIESDREFGVSVLQRLDAVLQERGDLFRRHNVQDIAGYRDKAESGERRAEGGEPTSINHQPSTINPLPRILLVIDEFQEFFVEDDRYSQQAALLLDRLVRQGRAFGVHVILGSQTLGGAYSLARSTLGQVAVRVALQCSETDAHLILSEDNTAARLLTRPGEAIYNDANGLIEGNHPFQIAWLPDEERAGYLGVMQHFAREQGITTEPPVVFEGNIPSDVSRNGELMSLIATQGDASCQLSVVSGPFSESENHSDSSSAPLQRTTNNGPRTPRIWLGEAVDIGPPTSITFAPQTGCNLLLVGSDPGATTGILTTSLIALAAQHPPSPRVTPRGSNENGDDQLDESAHRFYVFDGNPVGSPEAELWKQVASAVSADVRIITPPQAAQALAEITAERLRRDAQPGEVHPPLFVFIAGVSKFRDLRKGEDDFSLSGFGASNANQPPDPGKQFADLLAGGPEVGMHTLLWSDSYSNVDRWLSRSSLREFELRIAFPMNAADSSNYIDSPAASRLGVHRALLYREETGTFVKFRPYGPPSSAWLDKVRSALQIRNPLEPATDLDSFRVT